MGQFDVKEKETIIQQPQIKEELNSIQMMIDAAK